MENRLVIPSVLARYDGDERKLAETNLERLATLMPSASQVHNLVLFVHRRKESRSSKYSKSKRKCL